MPPASVGPDSEWYAKKPMVDGVFKFIGGERLPFAGEVTEITSPIIDAATGARAVIGKIPAFSEEDSIAAVKAAAAAWDRGQGPWPQMSLAERIGAVETLVANLTKIRTEIVDVLMWEICKNTGDAAKEFDRTMDFVRLTIAELRANPTLGTGFTKFTEVSGVACQVRRGPVGVMLGLAPFNYPLNEMYAMLIPALLMGNVAVLKLPAVGGLAHILTADAFAAALPPGVLNFITGSGKRTMPPIMESGLVDMIGFIGGTGAMDKLIKQHPEPHRLKVFAQLAGKNIGIVLGDADLEVAAEQCLLGSTAYNGQRCTAVKLMMVHESVYDAFLAKYVAKVNALKVGLPWEDKVNITPLPEPNKPAYLEELIADAVSKGATVANAEMGGGTRHGALFHPAVIAGVTKEMRIFQEEQFGPVLPVAKFSDLSEVYTALKESWNGQQSAIFTSNAAAAAPLIDALSSQVGRININMQCGRSPDQVPFSGRRSSAMGTMSITEALRAFSIETAVTYIAKDSTSVALGAELDKHSKFLAPLSAL
ncbi:Aldehyde/histidinol dehydrogenase [Pavlovales sp. CCMP2436]|nr:Aldehyde/histidinol dehydrogenase [Pavlovales sp. CCMP2436]